MEKLVHKTHIADFVDVLHMPSPLQQKGGAEGTCVTHFGATRRQEAVISRYFGDLTLDTVAEFAFSLESLRSGPVKLIVLDFSELHTCCRNAITHLVNFAASFQDSRARLILYRPSRALAGQLDDLGLSPLFTILTNEDDLILALPDFDAE